MKLRGNSKESLKHRHMRKTTQTRRSKVPTPFARIITIFDTRGCGCTETPNLEFVQPWYCHKQRSNSKCVLCFLLCTARFYLCSAKSLRVLDEQCLERETRGVAWGFLSRALELVEAAVAPPFEIHEKNHMYTVCVYVKMYVYIHMYVHIYIYIFVLGRFLQLWSGSCSCVLFYRYP